MRGTDTNSFDLELQAVGLRAMFAGLSFNNINDDQELLCLRLNIYEALVNWATFASEETHRWNPQH